VPINAERLAMLTTLGLTEYQGRAYLALLDLGEAPAKDVASLSRVPKSKIYAALDGLHEKGLAAILPEHPKRYRAEPIEGFLSSLRANLRDRLSTLARDEGSLVQEFRPQGGVALAERGGFTVLKGRRNVTARIVEMIGAAERSIRFAGSAGALARLLHHAHELKGAQSRGVALAVAAPGAESAARASLGDVARLADLSSEEPPASAGVSVLVVDETSALLVHAVPDDPKFYQGEDVAVWTDDTALARTLETLATRGERPQGAQDGDYVKLASDALASARGPVAVLVPDADGPVPALPAGSRVLQRRAAEAPEGVEVRAVPAEARDDLGLLLVPGRALVDLGGKAVLDLEGPGADFARLAFDAFWAAASPVPPATARLEREAREGADPARVLLALAVETLAHGPDGARRLDGLAAEGRRLLGDGRDPARSARLARALAADVEATEDGFRATPALVARAPAWAAFVDALLAGTPATKADPAR